MSQAPTVGLDPAIASRLAALVSERLPDVPADLLIDEARTDAGWWYVPIAFPGQAPRDYMSYEALTDIEREVEAEFSIRILLVPAI